MIATITRMGYTNYAPSIPYEKVKAGDIVILQKLGKVYAVVEKENNMVKLEG